MPTNEINEILYPNNYDTTMNWPTVEEVTQDTKEAINRNRDALLRIESVLGLRPNVGIYTTNTNPTVNERLEIIENGLAEGRFAWSRINVNNALVINTNQSSQTYVYIGRAQSTAYTSAQVFIKGPLRVEDSGIEDNHAIFQVPVKIEKSESSGLSTAVQITGTSSTTSPLLYIKDYYVNPQASDRLALKIEGNVLITGSIQGDISLSHTELRDIDTTPRSNQAQNSVRHVARGDYHSHKKDWNSYNETTGKYRVLSNPNEETYGIIDHMDLNNVFTKKGQTNFRPILNTAYHVTDGDDHDHTGGRGAQIDHSTLRNTDPATSNHVTDGDKHSHTFGSGGALLSHNDLLDTGALSHWAIDKQLTEDWNTLQTQVNEIENKNISLEQTINSLTSIVAVSTGGDSQFRNDKSYKVAGGRKLISATEGTTIIDTGLESVVTYSLVVEEPTTDDYDGNTAIKNSSIGVAIEEGKDGIGIILEHSVGIVDATYVRWFAMGY